MLNTKYVIVGEDKFQKNDAANGNVWFVERVESVNSANEEIVRLDSLNTKQEAIFTSPPLEKNLSENRVFKVDSLASIKLVEVKPNYLKYESNNSNDGFAVFSENYYGQGWQAYINGEETDHYRVNYVLRGMQIPAGNQSIEFKFEPQVVKKGSTIALGSSVLLVLLLIGGVYYHFRKKD